MDILNGKKILIIAPHQDDEVIGCGGLIGYAIDHDSSVEVVHVFAGSTGIATKPNGEETIRIRTLEAQAAAEEIGFTLLPNLGFEDRTRPSEVAIQESLIDVIRSSRPEIILLPHAEESDAEHSLVSRVGKEAAWLASANIETKANLKLTPPVKVVLYYSVWSPIATPALYLDITKYAKLKRRALAHYGSQMDETSWLDGSLGINQYWGTKIQSNGYVEVFGCNPIELGGNNG